MSKKYKIDDIKPNTDEHDQGYGFFVVTETAEPEVTLAEFCYAVPGVSSKLACECYPSKAQALRYAAVFAGVIDLWPDSASDTAPVDMAAVVRGEKAVAA
jgi:hypothetical protein